MSSLACFWSYECRGADPWACDAAATAAKLVIRRPKPARPKRPSIHGSAHRGFWPNCAILSRVTSGSTCQRGRQSDKRMGKIANLASPSREGARQEACVIAWQASLNWSAFAELAGLGVILARTLSFSRMAALLAGTVGCRAGRSETAGSGIESKGLAVCIFQRPGGDDGVALPCRASPNLTT